MILYLTTSCWLKFFYAGFEVAEITCPTCYFADASSINLLRSIQYGIGVLAVSFSLPAPENRMVQI
jgi:hypothetical protein